MLDSRSPELSLFLSCSRALYEKNQGWEEVRCPELPFVPYGARAREKRRRTQVSGSHSRLFFSFYRARKEREKKERIRLRPLRPCLSSPRARRKGKGKKETVTAGPIEKRDASGGGRLFP